MQELSGVSGLTRRGYHRALSSSLLYCSQGWNMDLIFFLDLTRRQSESERCKSEEANEIHGQHYCTFQHIMSLLKIIKSQNISD